MTRSSESFRIGVAGVGSLGFHHARILRDLEGVEMKGFYDVQRERAKEVEQALAVISTPSLDELLDQVEALVIATPTSSHEEVAVAAAARGIHLLIEKPIAPDLRAADRILSAAAETGAVVQIGHVERFNAAILAAEPFLDTPLFIESHRLAAFSPRGTDVAVVLDLMIHDVDLVHSLVGTPVEEIVASGVPILTPSVDIANARLSFQGGAVANLTASRVSMDRMRKIRIFQRSGYLSLDLANGAGEFLRLKEDLPLLTGNDEQPQLDLANTPDIWTLVERIPLEVEEVEPLRRELEDFRDAILHGGRPRVTGEDGRNALAVALSIEERIRDHVAYSRSS